MKSRMAWDEAETERRLAYLPAGLLAHCQRTSALCRELARRWGEEEGRAAWAGLVHDLARPLPELLSRARGYGLPINEVEVAMPLLLHGPVGAELLRREWGVEEEAVLEAVRWHTTGAAGMGRLAKLVFLADKLEPGKAELYPFIGRTRELAEKDLDQALVDFFSANIASLAQSGGLLHPAMVAARNDLLASLGRSGK